MKTIKIIGLILLILSLWGCASKSPEKSSAILKSNEERPDKHFLPGPTGGEISNLNIKMNQDHFDMTYDLLGAPLGAEVRFEISFDHGKSWIQPKMVKGDTGKSITNGKNKKILWFFQQEYPRGFNDELEVNVLTAAEFRNQYSRGDFQFIEGGCFRMGSPQNEVDRDGDEIQHKACLESFYMNKHEVTNAEYKRFKPLHHSFEEEAVNIDGDNQPAVNVSWQDAIDYTDWLSERSGVQYRLPTEVEWEYAARGGIDLPWYWGSPNKICEYANIRDQKAQEQFGLNVELSCNDGHAITAEVEHYKENAYGLYDMIGNAWEWTCSLYDNEYQGSEKTCADPANQSDLRTIRGGSWSDDIKWARSATRSSAMPNDTRSKIGFRLVHDL